MWIFTHEHEWHVTLRSEWTLQIKASLLGDLRFALSLGAQNLQHFLFYPCSCWCRTFSVSSSPCPKNWSCTSLTENLLCSKSIYNMVGEVESWICLEGEVHRHRHLSSVLRPDALFHQEVVLCTKAQEETCLMCDGRR